MNVKSLIVLLMLAAAAVGAVVWTTRSPQPPQIASEQPLVPGLEADINKVAALRLTKAGSETVVELKRGEQGWVVANKGDYPADMGQVRKTLLALAEAKLIEQKTSNPEYYERLGVQDLSDAGAAGTQVDIEGLAEPVSVIIGDGASATNGTYTRRAGDAESWLASGDLTVPRTTSQWLDRSVLDIPAERIQRVTIRHPDGEVLTVSKNDRNQNDFAVFNLPAERELEYDAVANPIGGVLAGLQLDDVTPIAELKPEEQEGVEVEYVTFDGLKIAASAFQTEDTPYVRFDVSFDEEQARHFADAEEAGADQEGETTTVAESDTEETSDATASETGESAQAEPPATDILALQDEAKRLNERLSAWVYAIPKYQYDNMTQRMDDLLKPLETEPAPEAEPSE